jgi:hypothetical protein
MSSPMCWVEPIAFSDSYKWLDSMAMHQGANLSKALPRCDTGTPTPPPGTPNASHSSGEVWSPCSGCWGRQLAPVGHPSTARAGPGPAGAASFCHNSDHQGSMFVKKHRNEAKLRSQTQKSKPRRTLCDPLRGAVKAFRLLVFFY